MKRRTNPSSRPALPRAVVPQSPDLPRDLIDAIELWSFTVMDPRSSSVGLRQSLESQLAEDGVKIVPTSKLHKGCRVHQVFYHGAPAFTLSVGSA